MEKTCPYCGSEGPHTVTPRTSGVHYADINCAACEAHLGFAPKPDSDASKYRRPAGHRELVKEYGAGICEMCLRPADTLPKGQTLEAQHVIEFSDGGSNERHNIWILCTACHRLVHWLRIYHGAKNG